MLEIQRSCHPYAPKTIGFMPRITCFIHKVLFTTIFMNEVMRGISLQMYCHEGNVERHFAQSLRTEFTQLIADSTTIQESPIMQTLN
jgi:hypothetical protein